MTGDAAALASRIKRKADELGFAACGITTAEPLEGHGRFLDWIGRGLYATMAWIARDDALRKRADVRFVIPAAKSVICVAMHYRTDEPWDETAHGLIARYARGVDYHDVMADRLRQLLESIRETCQCAGRVYVDTGPLLERELARRAGIGWIGKNTMLMSRRLGSYFLLGELILDIELPPDRPHLEQYCGSCTRCLDACPTGAFVSPYQLDANKCISFQTIESRTLFDKDLGTKFGDWVFGCDICQEVCPWNGKSTYLSGEPELWTRPGYARIEDMLSMSPAEFAENWRGSPVKRARRRGLKRNALAVLKSRRAKAWAEERR